MSLGSSSSVHNPQIRVRPTEGDEVLIEASKDLLRAHVRLIMAGVLTMEESKPIVFRAFGALRGPDLDIEGDRLTLVIVSSDYWRTERKRSLGGS